jgi:hypothetical protein
MPCFVEIVMFTISNHSRIAYILQRAYRIRATVQDSPLAC